MQYVHVVIMVFFVEHCAFIAFRQYDYQLNSFHFKGNCYNVVGVACTPCGAVSMMVYQPLGGPHPLRPSHRPTALFRDDVDRPELNYKGLRFLRMQTYSPRIETNESLLAKVEPCG